MMLVELSPRWIADTTFAFLCPHCRAIYLTCTLEKTPRRKQCEATAAGEFEGRVVLCDPECSWTLKNGKRDFASMSVTPSLDASKSGHWHGHITNGAIA